MVQDGVFLLFTVLSPPTSYFHNCWRSCVLFCWELAFDKEGKAVELGDQITYFRGGPCMKLTCNFGSAIIAVAKCLDDAVCWVC